MDKLITPVGIVIFNNICRMVYRYVNDRYKENLSKNESTGIPVDEVLNYFNSIISNQEYKKYVKYAIITLVTNGYLAYQKKVRIIVVKDNENNKEKKIRKVIKYLIPAKYLDDNTFLYPITSAKKLTLMILADEYLKRNPHYITINDKHSVEIPFVEIADRMKTIVKYSYLGTLKMINRINRATGTVHIISEGRKYFENYKVIIESLLLDGVRKTEPKRRHSVDNRLKLVVIRTINSMLYNIRGEKKDTFTINELITRLSERENIDKNSIDLFMLHKILRYLIIKGYIRRTSKFNDEYKILKEIPLPRTINNKQKVLGVINILRNSGIRVIELPRLVERISAETGLTNVTVRKYLKILDEEGIIRIEGGYNAKVYLYPEDANRQS